MTHNFNSFPPLPQPSVHLKTQAKCAYRGRLSLGAMEPQSGGMAGSEGGCGNGTRGSHAAAYQPTVQAMPVPHNAQPTVPKTYFAIKSLKTNCKLQYLTSSVFRDIHMANSSLLPKLSVTLAAARQASPHCLCQDSSSEAEQAAPAGLEG